jgi:hypothetical protein
MGVRELPMSLRWARLVHEKLAVIATFAYSQTALKEEIEKHFRGEWKFLHKIIYELPHEEATKAPIELALYFRAFDDEQDLCNVSLRAVAAFLSSTSTCRFFDFKKRH